MKKAIMSKRGRRFDEGGFISSESQEMPRARTAQDDREAADKAEGLAASNKEKSTGFFERLRMGNIDDPSSEAYRRFGAGRGRSERIPVEDKSFTSVEVPKITSRSDGMGGVNAAIQARKNAEAAGEPQASGDASVAEAMASKPSMPAAPAKPSVSSKPASKVPAKKYDPTAGEAKDKAAQAAADEMGDRPKKPAESIMKKKPVANASTFDAYQLNNFSTPKAQEEKPKSTYKKNATYSSSGRKAGTSKSSKENDVDFGGTGLGMKRGGSVSKASSRADGIAQRGKTRGVMR